MIRQALAALLLAASGTAAACPVPGAGTGVDIYPTADELPANLLRFFVYFPRPMDRNGIVNHLVLVDETGQEVEGALLSNRYDLWSPDARRLTVLLDPGRVKTGLAVHDAMGRALETGQRYALVVRPTAQDAQGCTLGAETAHAFVAGDADFDPPAPGDWTLIPPRVASRLPLIVGLGSPHDHLSLVYRLRVLGADGSPVTGRIELGDDEATWRFTPTSPWQDGPHSLAIDERLEDLAGNRPGTLFDQPSGAPVAQWPRALTWTPQRAAP